MFAGHAAICQIGALAGRGGAASLLAKNRFLAVHLALPSVSDVSQLKM